MSMGRKMSLPASLPPVRATAAILQRLQQASLDQELPIKLQLPTLLSATSASSKSSTSSPGAGKCLSSCHGGHVESGKL